MVTLRVRQGQAAGYIPQPTAEVIVAVPATYRQKRAMIFKIAALVELASTTRETWLVQVDDHRGLVYLELGTATEGENERGLEVLEAVADKIRRNDGVVA